MKREIKFRAWDKFDNKWRYFTIGQSFTVLAESLYSSLCLEGATFYQYTGLNDKNGNEIYEGDVIKRWHGNTTVIWEQETAAFCLKWDGDTTDLLSLFVEENQFEVVGNIYENPELLKA